MSTSKTGTTGKATTGPDSTVRRGLRSGEHVVSLQFGAWGPQEVIVRAYSAGGRGGAPYIVVGVGTCLTYAYDQAAVASFLCTRTMRATGCKGRGRHASTQSGSLARDVNQLVTYCRFGGGLC